MTDPSSSRSSVLYALGRLDAKVEDHAKAIEAIPSQVAALLNPRLVTLEASSVDYSKRLHALERRQWIWIGGGGVLIILTGYVVNFISPLHLIH